MARPRRNAAANATERKAETYRHPEAESPLRPDVGTQAQFRKKKPPQKYRYDSSLSPLLEWDGRNSARELGAWLIKMIEKAAALKAPHAFAGPQEFKGNDGTVIATVRNLREAVDALARLSKPFLNWAGKAERLSFDVPTLPLFIHERLSTKAIIETLKAHKRVDQFELFADPQHSITDQVLKAYEYRDKWVNRMIAGDSLVVMNSLLRYEGLGAQVQMVYMAPPYGVKFGSNFQPFVRKRDVKHNEDDDMTREPEMVKAYRDTWELGLHSYLTYLRDRLFLCRDLLASSGSMFVQINDQNAHHVREVMDDVFGEDNFVAQINFQTTTGFETTTIATMGDFLLWYAKDQERLKVRKLYDKKELKPGEGNARWILLPDGSYRGVTRAEASGEEPLPRGVRLYNPDNLISQGAASEPQPFKFEGDVYEPGGNAHWKANYPEGMKRLAKAGRIHVARNSIRYRRFADDFPYQEIGNFWTDTGTGSFTEDKLFVVQTNTKVIERCILLCTDPGDLVLDPTCGSGTTAYVAEKWGRRWITIDVSRVPLALARQRLLTATYPWYELKDGERGPAGGFVYKRKHNSKGEDVGGIVPHVTLKAIANDEPPEEEVLVDRPEVESKVTRVTGPFTLEATIPTPVDWEGDGIEDSGAAEGHGSFVDRMLEVLRRSPVLQVGGGKTVVLKNIRPPAKTLSLSAEALVANGEEKPVAIVFGPENGAISEKFVQEAIKEANLKGYDHLYVIGFAVQPNARMLIEKSAEMGTLAATYVQATPDLMMGDLLKNMRSSQIFSVCGMPEIKVKRIAPAKKGEPPRFTAELVGLDTFDPATMHTEHMKGEHVPAWFLDTDYNSLCFHVSQAFFPRTAAWDDLKKALRGSYNQSVWDHLAGTRSAPFEAGEHGQVAVKVIDYRGNELMVVKSLKEAQE